MVPDPLVPTSSLRPLLTLVVAAAFLVMGMVAISWVVHLAAAQWLAASLATAAMGGLAVRLSTCSAMPPMDSLPRTVGWSVLLGLVNVPVSFLAASLVERFDVYIIPFTIVVGMIGAPFGLTLGLAFGLALSVPVAALMRAWLRPSPTGNDDAVLVFGMWLVLVSGVAALLATSPLTLGPSFELWVRELEPWRAFMPHAIAWIVGGLGLTLAAAAWQRRLARRRFVVRVARNETAEWRVIEATRDHAALAHLPCLGETAIDCDHLLVRCESPGEGAYRRAASEWPVAWVPRSWLAAARHGR